MERIYLRSADQEIPAHRDDLAWTDPIGSSGNCDSALMPAEAPGPTGIE